MGWGYGKGGTSRECMRTFTLTAALAQRGVVAHDPSLLRLSALTIARAPGRLARRAAAAFTLRRVGVRSCLAFPAQES